MPKNALLKERIITSGDMSQSFITSSITGIQYLDNIGIQLNWTGTPIGSFSFQVSIDHAQDNRGNVTVVGNWVTLAVSPTIAAAGTSDQAYVDINQTGATFIRVLYTKTSGTGTLNAFLSAKEV
jgi:hypothetical protein